MEYIIDVLCNQVIDVFLINQETYSVIDNSKLTKYPEKFVKRIDSVQNYCYKLFVEADNGEYNLMEINILLLNLLHNIKEYRNSYNETSYAYKVMNSLLDIVEESFIDINY